MERSQKTPVDGHPARNPAPGPDDSAPPPGGSPVEVRDASLRRPAPFGVYERAGEPGTGRSAEDDVPISTPHANPSAAPKGWTLGGMTIPVLILVALLIALAAWAL